MNVTWLSCLASGAAGAASQSARWRAPDLPPVESDSTSTPACLKASLKRGFALPRRFGKAGAELACRACPRTAARRSRHLPCTIGPMSGSSTSRGSHRRTASTSWRWLSRLSGRSQPGALMKSEMTKTSERRLIACKPAFEQRRQVGERRARQARLLEQVVDQAQHLDPPAAGRDRALDPAAVEHRADPVAVAGQQARQGGHEIDQHRCASCSVRHVPKSTDGLRSSRNQAVISRSSTYWRT